MESAEVYQNRTGEILNEMKEEGLVKETRVALNGNNIPFVARPEENPPDPNQDILEATQAFIDFCANSADFAELCAYVMLCKIYDEIGDNITGMRVLPKGERTHQLNGVDDEIDAWLEMRDEYIPIEVYNGRDYLGIEARSGGHSEKYGQMVNRSNDEHPISNPMLINRRADNDMQTKVREELDGIVANTDVIIACEESHPDIQDALDLLNLNQVVELIPPLETESGVELNGPTYDALTTEDPSVLTPPNEIASAAENLPEQYRKRIRGGVQLHYVNSFYRSTDDRIKREASFMLQEIYNLLLREGGMDRDTVLDRGWEEFSKNYRQIQKAEARKGIIREQVSDYLTRLVTKRILTQRDDRLHARKATHPQPTFSF